MTEVPPLPPEWPLDEFQLAGLLTEGHWMLEQLAFDIPRREVDRGRLDRAATVLERMAYLLRQHNVDDNAVPPAEPPPDRLDEPDCDCKDCRRQRGED